MTQSKKKSKLLVLMLVIAMIATQFTSVATAFAGTKEATPFTEYISDMEGNKYELVKTDRTVQIDKYGFGDPEDIISVNVWECQVPSGTTSVKLNGDNPDAFVKISDIGVGVYGNGTYELWNTQFSSRWGDENALIIDRGFNFNNDPTGRFHAISFVEKKSGDLAENVKKVIAAIDAIPAIDKITFKDRVEVSSARHIYDLLNSDEKKLVNNYDKLVAAEAKVAELKANRFTDGTFVGKGQGLKGDIVLKTTVKDGDIKSIEVVETHETPDLWRNTAHKVIESIITRNDTDVDAIVGATYASNGIINATKDALSKAAAYIGVQVDSVLPESYTNDLWLQYDHKEMNVNDTAKLNPRRVEEAITDVINNNVELPHFNYEIIKGNDVVEIDSSNNAHAIVTAKKEGTAIVKVTYDALQHSAGKSFAACDAVNTAYVVYTVGGNKNITVTDNIVLEKPKAGEILFRSYDTLYFAEGETAPLEISAKQTGAEKLEVFCNGLAVNGKDGKYILPLENRSNIIEMKATAADGTSRSLFRVLDARKIKVNVENKTNPGKPLMAGDTAKVSFKGITLPVYKLATIYNPAFSSPWGGKSARVVYNCGNKTYEGIGGQYNLATKNSFEVKCDKAGEYEFTNGYIYEEWWGKGLGADKTTDNPGAPGFNAKILKSNFSSMPSFVIKVAVNVKADAKKEIQDYKDLNDYRDAEKTEINKIIADAEKAIDAGKTNEDVAKAITEAKAKLDAVKTDAQLDAEELAAKEAAKNEVKSYKNLNDYRDAEKAEINKIIANAEKAIDAGKTNEDVAKAVTEAKAKLDLVKTDAQLDKEEAEKPVKPEKDDVDNNKVDNDKTDNNKTDVKDETAEETPKTGDSSDLYGWMLLLGVAGAAVAVAKQRKENN